MVKLRPRLDHLLEAISSKYEIYIYTYGTKEYALEIIKYINSTFDKNYLSIDRLVARENLNIDQKSIKRIFPTIEDMVVIVDDRMDVWKDVHNLINLTPYLFFYDEKMFPIEEKYSSHDLDNVLYTIEKVLLYTQEVYYSYYDTYNKRSDVKLILEEKFHNIFKGLAFTLSNIYTKDINLYETKHNYIIQAFGGALFTDYFDEVNYILTKPPLTSILIYIK